MKIARLAMYFISALSASALAGALLQIKNWVSRLFGAVMVAWALNHFVLFLGLFQMQVTGHVECLWEIAWVANAALSCIVSTVALVVFIKEVKNGR